MGSEESKRESFERLAASRAAAAADALRRIGNLANTRYYAYGPDDVDAMFDRLQAQLDSARARYEDGLRRGGGR